MNDPLEDPAIDRLCNTLADLATDLDRDGGWPAEQLQLCGEAGVFRWFLAPEWGGTNWSSTDIVRGYLRLSAACLSTTFIITQRSGACRRIADSENLAMQQRWLPGLATGEQFATVGISHLTTSRRHLNSPVLTAKETSTGYRLDGFSPWVTGGNQAEMVVVGATLDDGRQILIALPMDLPGISTPDPPNLIGLTSSQTGSVQLDGVEVTNEQVIAGPVKEVMSGGGGGATGGPQTSTLAIGAAKSSIDYLRDEAEKRQELLEPWEKLHDEHAALEADLLALAGGEPVCSNEALRQRSNSLVLRASQAALAAAKGSGYVVGHPAGRWCREALFFLVWSCPQSVMQAHLCELAGIAD